MSEEISECLDLKQYCTREEIKEFLERDGERIQKIFPNKDSGNNNYGEELIYLTPRMCWMVPFDNFKESYKKLFNSIVGIVETLKSHGIDVNCKEVELIFGDGVGAHHGTAFQFKLTFEK